MTSIHRYSVYPVASLVEMAQVICEQAPDSDLEDAIDLVSRYLDYTLLGNTTHSPLQPIIEQCPQVEPGVDAFHDTCVAILGTLALDDYEIPVWFQIQGTQWLAIGIGMDHQAMIDECSYFESVAL